MARWMLSLGILAAVALSQARRRRGLASGSGPPARAATVISRMILVQSLPRFASWRPLRCWMFAHLLCPAIKFPQIAEIGSKPEILTDAAASRTIAGCLTWTCMLGPGSGRLQLGVMLRQQKVWLLQAASIYPIPTQVFYVRSCCHCQECECHCRNAA